MKRSGLQSFVIAREALSIFQEITRQILPEDIFKEITPISFQNGILKVRTSHPIISMELRSHENAIFQKMPLKKMIIET